MTRPPYHCIQARVKRSAAGAVSAPRIMVSPVVVTPETASNSASSKARPPAIRGQVIAPAAAANRSATMTRASLVWMWPGAAMRPRGTATASTAASTTARRRANPYSPWPSATASGIAIMAASERASWPQYLSTIRGRTATARLETASAGMGGSRPPPQRRARWPNSSTSRR